MTDLSLKIPLNHFSFHFHTHVADDHLSHSFFKPSTSKGVHLVIKAENSQEVFIENVLHWLLSYFYRKQLPDFPKLKIEGSPFMVATYETLLRTPLGTTLSYQELAQLTHHPGAARAAGSACHHNKLPLWIPCHRVIHTDHRLGGFAFGPSIKKQLLQHEGHFQSSMDLFEPSSS